MTFLEVANLRNISLNWKN